MQPLGCDSTTRLSLVAVTKLKDEELKDKVQGTTLLWELLELGRQVGAKRETSFWCLGWDSLSPLLFLKKKCPMLSPVTWQRFFVSIALDTSKSKYQTLSFCICAWYRKGNASIFYLHHSTHKLDVITDACPGKHQVCIPPICLRAL